MSLRERIAARAVAHVSPGSIVNLGIGIPTFVADHLRPVDVVVTEAATLRVRDGGLVLVEVAEDVTLDRVRERTSAPFTVELAEVAHA